MVLIEGDELKTGPRGAAKVRLGAGAVLLVAGTSDLVLDGNVDAPILRFKIGEWLPYAAQNPLRNRRVRIVTPQAAVEVGGSLCFGRTDPRKTVLMGFEDIVEVTAAGRRAVFGPGQMVRIPSGGPPERSVPSQEIDDPH